MKPGRIWPGVGVGAVVPLYTDVPSQYPSLLMVQRAGAHGAGKWSVPGGWVEKGEDPLRTAEREVFEETGVIVTAAAEWGWTSHVHDENPADVVHAVTLWVFCEYRSGDPAVVEPDKNPVVRWVNYPDIAALDLFAPFNTWWPIGSNL